MPAPYCTPTAGTTLKLTEVASGLERPVLVTAPVGDARAFIVEQPGRIRILASGALVDTPFLDITELVTDQGDEQGLLGLAFHPSYASNGKFYVHYSDEAADGGTVIAEYTVSADANVASTTERRILTEPQPASNHNGGMIAFGPDGFLYIALGDGGGANDSFNNGQNPASKLAKLLRIDVDTGDPYGIPAGNPWASGEEGVAEMFVRGLRNPWRFSIDQNGDVFIGDVGQGRQEEIDVVPAGTSDLDFGWPVFEGEECFTGDSGGDEGCDRPGDFTAPLVVETQDDGWCSIVAGPVYRGACMPDLVGTFFYGDYCLHEIHTLVYANGQATARMDRTADLDPDGLLGPMPSFGVDGFNELYVMTFEGGKVFRVEVEAP